MDHLHERVDRAIGDFEVGHAAEEQHGGTTSQGRRNISVSQRVPLHEPHQPGFPSWNETCRTFTKRGRQERGVVPMHFHKQRSRAGVGANKLLKQLPTGQRDASPAVDVGGKGVSSRRRKSVDWIKAIIRRAEALNSGSGPSAILESGSRAASPAASKLSAAACRTE
jgi:hypothetical protein